MVVPTYNRAHLVARALHSLGAQELDNLEVIVVDDGSTDTTKSVVQSFAHTDARIRYVYQDNRGLAGARNTGIAESRADYVTFLDSDDEYLPSHLRLRTEYLDDRPAVDMIHGGLQIVNGDWLVPDYYKPGNLVDLRECAVGSTFFFRRRLIDMIGGFVHQAFGEDTEFHERAAAAAHVERVEWPTYRYYRDTTDSLVAQEISRSIAPDERGS